MSVAGHMLASIWAALEGDSIAIRRVEVTGQGALPSAFAVSDLAVASTASAALALSEYVSLSAGASPEVRVDRRLASFWFAKSIRPVGWQAPPQWDAIAGNYVARDGWVRLHTNAPHHRDAVLAVLNVPAHAESVSAAVADWDADALENAVVARGGCAAMMRSLEEWKAHPQGMAVATEPLIAWLDSGVRRQGPPCGKPGRPLAGLRVLDLTRVLAGPVATRFLAGFGADVLRIDPPFWDEPAVLPEVSVGKTRARLDLRKSDDMATLRALMAQADVLVHGYRSDALDRLGFDVDARRMLNPQLIDVALDAYGWTGPWAKRRGFDTIVQMSAGLANAEMMRVASTAPLQLPVQALDYATGHLMAASVLRALARGNGCSVRLSLARCAAFLADHPAKAGVPDFAPECVDDLSDKLEQTHWGQAFRLKAPFSISGLDMSWSRPAGMLGDGLARFTDGE